MIRVFDVVTKELVISDDKSYGYVLDYTNGRSILTFEDKYSFSKNKGNEGSRIYSKKNKEIFTDQSRKYIYYSAVDDSYDLIKIIYPFKASIDKNDNSERNFILDTDLYYQYHLPKSEREFVDCFGILRDYAVKLAYNLSRIADEIFNKNKYYSYTEFERKIDKAIPGKKAYFDNLRFYLRSEQITNTTDLLKYIREND